MHYFDFNLLFCYEYKNERYCYFLCDRQKKIAGKKLVKIEKKHVDTK